MNSFYSRQPPQKPMENSEGRVGIVSYKECTNGSMKLEVHGELSTVKLNKYGCIPQL